MSALGIVNPWSGTLTWCAEARRAWPSVAGVQKGELPRRRSWCFHAGPEEIDEMDHGETGLGVCCASVFPFRVSCSLKMQRNRDEY